MSYDIEIYGYGRKEIITPEPIKQYLKAEIMLLGVIKDIEDRFCDDWIMGARLVRREDVKPEPEPWTDADDRSEKDCLWECA